MSQSTDIQKREGSYVTSTPMRPVSRRLPSRSTTALKSTPTMVKERIGPNRILHDRPEDLGRNALGTLDRGYPRALSE
jgi:hypothetical protein